jgi:triphosphoribosyl-dephospho-CoA synthase
VIGHPLGSAGTRPLGATIRLAVEATRRLTNVNTNLGIVLLLAPLARAAALSAASESEAIGPGELRAALTSVLASTTVEDARDTYTAIRLASPGGLGSADEQDVADEPTVTLTAAMQLAADRDGIASEYTTDFHTTFAVAGEVMREACAVLDLGGVRSESGRAAIGRLDASLRGEHNLSNPGTTADLTAAAIFVTLLSDGWRSGAGGTNAARR